MNEPCEKKYPPSLAALDHAARESNREFAARKESLLLNQITKGTP